MIILPYDDAAASLANLLRKVRIGRMDLKIASIVLASEAVLVTRNAVDFRLVPDLTIEDWSVES